MTVTRKADALIAGDIVSAPVYLGGAEWLTVGTVTRDEAAGCPIVDLTWVGHKDVTRLAADEAVECWEDPFANRDLELTGPELMREHGVNVNDIPLGMVYGINLSYLATWQPRRARFYPYDPE